MEMRLLFKQLPTNPLGLIVHVLCFLGVNVFAIECTYIHRGYYMTARIRKFSSSVEKYFTRERNEGVKYFSTREEKFRISKRACNVLFIR